VHRDEAHNRGTNNDDVNFGKRHSLTAVSLQQISLYMHGMSLSSFRSRECGIRATVLSSMLATKIARKSYIARLSMNPLSQRAGVMGVKMQPTAFNIGSVANTVAVGL
jgi:hypothetical protein